ncbi:hypothetical protein WS70_08300 [Burkholderia mayonis]|uniref:Uncharacterized protein n=1 Tax=Burkholderia mayonis TaxID=1385591 RepID=A0A1B4FDV6_9BURK|nr:hypothetical protein WS70_08300 [Burkholderia mayonis]KVE47309.1 hypothetical protein WS70_26120 [Burkholderia mayonis]
MPDRQPGASDHAPRASRAATNRVFGAAVSARDAGTTTGRERPRAAGRSVARAAMRTDAAASGECAWRCARNPMRSPPRTTHDAPIASSKRIIE